MRTREQGTSLAPSEIVLANKVLILGHRFDVFQTNMLIYLLGKHSRGEMIKKYLNINLISEQSTMYAQQSSNRNLLRLL